jgi:hypothetical protein
MRANEGQKKIRGLVTLPLVIELIEQSLIFVANYLQHGEKG